MITLDQNTYYLLLGIIILLSAILVGVIISYFITLRRLVNFEKKEDEIIQAAQYRATEIISQADNIHDTSNQALEKATETLEKHEEEKLTQQSEEALKKFQQTIDQLNTDNIQMFNNTSEDIKKTVNLHFDELKKLLSEQTVASKKMAEEKVKEEYETLEKELEAYKKSQMEKIDSNIFRILESVSKNVLGKKLDTTQHEEMITKALEEAEREIAAD